MNTCWRCHAKNEYQPAPPPPRIACMHVRFHHKNYLIFLYIAEARFFIHGFCILLGDLLIFYTYSFYIAGDFCYTVYETREYLSPYSLVSTESLSTKSFKKERLSPWFLIFCAEMLVYCGHFLCKVLFLTYAKHYFS